MSEEKEKNKIDMRGTHEQLNEIAEKLQLKGNILAVGDSARPYAILNMDYLRKNKDKTNCIGVNLDPTAVGKYDHFEILYGNGNDMSFFKDSTFDAVFAVMLFEHDLYFWKTVKEIKRVLKPGGVFINAVPGFVDKEEVVGVKQGTVTYMLHEAENVDDYYRFSQKSIEKLFFQGYERVTTKRYQSPPRLLTYGFKSKN